MNKPFRVAEPMGILHLEDIDWYFRVYLMKGDPTETVERSALFGELMAQVRIVASDYLSSEYKYTRSGFVLAHYGRRGVTHSVWHWADWEGTWEYFCQAWYCYGRALCHMAPLDRTEPIFCYHELDLLLAESLAFRSVASQYSTFEEIVSRYREQPFYSASRP